jgi:outer membrane lipopolysaccharide assembly protein LptE/RlpB
MWFSSSASEAYGAARRPPCIARPWWLLPLLLALASCGFQLRSSMGNLGEIQQIYLKTANPILREELR